jgi:hypothetical protein
LLDPDILASLYSFLINSESERFCVKYHSSVFQKIRVGWCLYSALWKLEDSYCI